MNKGHYSHSHIHSSWDIVTLWACLLRRFCPVLLFATPWTVAHQAPLSMGFSRQEHWSGFPRSPPGDLPDPGIKPVSLTPPALAGGFYTTGATWIVLYCSVAQSHLTHCNPMDCSMPGFPVLHHLPELTQTHVCWVGDATQPSCPLSSPGKPTANFKKSSSDWVTPSTENVHWLPINNSYRIEIQGLGQAHYKLSQECLWEFQKNMRFCFIDHAKAFDCVGHNKLRKILKEMGIPDHLTCVLRNPYVGQEATVRTGHGTTDWFQIGKGARQGCVLSPCLFNLYAKYIMRNAGLDETQAGIKIAGRNINNLRYADDTTLTAESEEKLKSLLMKVKEESEKVGLKLNLQKLRSWHLVPSPHGK